MLSFVRSRGVTRAFFAMVVVCIVLHPSRSLAQANWTWTREYVDASGRGTSLAADAAGNVHISYGANKGGLSYGFRPAGVNTKWYTMVLGGGVSFTNLKLDQRSTPRICATYFTLPLRYAHLEDKGWQIEEIAPEDNMSVQAECSVAIGPDGTPHLSWYRIPPNDHTYAHMRYAYLKDGVWLMKTLDFDMQTGKWNSMLIDPQGHPEISYDCFVKGLMKVASWNGTDWTIRIVDSRGAHGDDYSLGMGSSLMLDAQGIPHVSYYTDTEVRHAWLDGQTWKVETVEKVTPSGSAYDYRTTLLLDREGTLHVSYEDNGVLKHAFKEGDQWRVQVIAGTGTNKSRFSSMTIDRTQDILYIAFSDPVDSSLKVAVGRKSEPSQTALDKNSTGKN